MAEKVDGNEKDKTVTEEMAQSEKINTTQTEDRELDDLLDSMYYVGK